MIRTERLVLRPYGLADFVKLRDLYQTERSRHNRRPLAEHRVWYGFMDMIGHCRSWLRRLGVDLAETGELIGEWRGPACPFPESSLAGCSTKAMRQGLCP